MTQKYKYEEKLVISNGFEFWFGMFLVVVNGIAVTWGLTSIEEWIGGNPLWLMNIFGIPIGMTLLSHSASFKKKRVPVSSRDAMKDDLKNG